MRKAASIYGDKEYIEYVDKEYVVFVFQDGTRDKLKTRKSELQQVCEWYRDETQFYYRVYTEISDFYSKEKKKFLASHHYYDDEEIKKACQKNRFANIDMEISNSEYLRKWNGISGIHNTAMEMWHKYSNVSKKYRQIIKVLNAM